MDPAGREDVLELAKDLARNKGMSPIVFGTSFQAGVRDGSEVSQRPMGLENHSDDKESGEGNFTSAQHRPPASIP